MEAEVTLAEPQLLRAPAEERKLVALHHHYFQNQAWPQHKKRQKEEEVEAVAAVEEAVEEVMARLSRLRHRHHKRQPCRRQIPQL